MCFNILLFLKIDQIIVKIGKFFTWNLIQCRYKIIFIIFMNQKSVMKRQIKNLKKKKKKKNNHQNTFIRFIPFHFSFLTKPCKSILTPHHHTTLRGSVWGGGRLSLSFTCTFQQRPLPLRLPRPNIREATPSRNDLPPSTRSTHPLAPMLRVAVSL